MAKTGIKELDKFLDYGNSLTLVYGPPASGKTTMCYHAAISCALEGKKVYFIDTEAGFSTERIKQMGGEDALSNILVVKVNDLKKQCFLSKKLLELNDIGLAIVDSATMNYREAKHRKFDANPWMSRHISELKDLTRKGIPVIITSQVYTKMDGQLEVVGSSMIKNWSEYVIKLDKTPKKSFMLIEKHPSLQNKNFDFEIANEGIVIRALSP